jgi:uncharacterized protein (DUF736 family)
MAFELKDGQGTLFKNDKKGNEKAPDYRGEAMIDGVMHKVAGWLKDGKNGKWMSLKLEVNDPDAARERSAAKRAHDPDADAPF